MGLEDKWLQEGKEIAPVAQACIDEDGMIQGANLVSHYCMLAMEDLACPYKNNRFMIHNMGQSFPHCMYQRKQSEVYENE